jgi:hypothetical protein
MSHTYASQQTPSQQLDKAQHEQLESHCPVLASTHYARCRSQRKHTACWQRCRGLQSRPQLRHLLDDVLGGAVRVLHSGLQPAADVLNAALRLARRVADAALQLACGLVDIRGRACGAHHQLTSTQVNMPGRQYKSLMLCHADTAKMSPACLRPVAFA